MIETKWSQFLCTTTPTTSSTTSNPTTSATTSTITSTPTTSTTTANPSISPTLHPSIDHTQIHQQVHPKLNYFLNHESTSVTSPIMPAHYGNHQYLHYSPMPNSVSGQNFQQFNHHHESVFQGSVQSTMSSSIDTNHASNLLTPNSNPIQYRDSVHSGSLFYHNQPHTLSPKQLMLYQNVSNLLPAHTPDLANHLPSPATPSNMPLVSSTYWVDSSVAEPSAYPIYYDQKVLASPMYSSRVFTNFDFHLGVQSQSLQSPSIHADCASPASNFYFMASPDSTQGISSTSLNTIDLFSQLSNPEFSPCTVKSPKPKKRRTKALKKTPTAQSVPDSLGRRGSNRGQRWTQEEIDILQRGVNRHGRNFTAIYADHGPGGLIDEGLARIPSARAIQAKAYRMNMGFKSDLSRSSPTACTSITPSATTALSAASVFGEDAIPTTKS